MGYDDIECVICYSESGLNNISTKKMHLYVGNVCNIWWVNHRSHFDL